jgi:uncharacterized protein YdeI (YjbR/CyaY-like superfamily)
MKTKRDPKVDAYIELSAEFARPILRHLRKLVHQGCPAAQEAVKWSMPFFLHQGILCHMAAFKEHCSFGFWGPGMRALLKKDGLSSTGAMGSLGAITSLNDLPDDKTLLRYIREAVKFKETGGPARATKPRPPAKVPADLAAALRKDKKAAANFEKFTAYQRREYVEWITEAKQQETREKRMAIAIEWLAEGKVRNWKYQKR